MAGLSELHYATPEAEAYLRHMASVLLTSNRAAIHVQRILFLRETRYFPRQLLNRLMMVLDCWQAYFKPWSEHQASVYQLARLVDFREQLSNLECRYVGHVCASPDLALHQQIREEIICCGQLSLPEAFQDPSEEMLFASLRAVHALRQSRLAASSIVPPADLLP